MDDQWLAAYASAITRAADATRSPEERSEQRQRAWFIARVLELVR